MSRALAELLIKDKFITEQQFTQAAELIKNNVQKSFIRYFISEGIVNEQKLLLHFSQRFGLPTINLAKFEISGEVIARVNPDLVLKFQCIPIQFGKNTLVVALSDPTYLQAYENLKFALKVNVEAVLTTFSAFDAALQKYYSGRAAVGAALDSYAKGKKEDGAVVEQIDMHEIEDVPSSDQEAPVIMAVNGILSEAIRKGASDIHIEPYEKRFRVRIRVDGTLYEMTQLPTEMKRALVARVKIMSKLDIAESRVPQDGRIKLKVGMSEIDFRVNSMPTLFGEKIVLRLLNKGNLQLNLQKLGFDPQQFEIFKKGIDAPNGMVLVTGPTGSGKTTTLYSALSDLNKVGDNLSTAEDPVEYNLDGINQVQVHKEIGLTFASVLRALLRQDPDTILVGEIRDYETAEVAVQAALTGHLVLSTLHTNDSVSTITRLMNMGLEPFLIVSATNTIVAQRLLRTICPNCKTEVKMPPDQMIKMGIPEKIAATLKPYKGAGCGKCNNFGYKGRVAIYEILDMSSGIKEMVLSGATVMELKRQAIKEGMKTLRDSAITRVVEGRTTLEEALSSTMEN